MLKLYIVQVEGNTYEIEAYSKNNAINRISKKYNLKSQTGIEYYVTEKK